LVDSKEHWVRPVTWLNPRNIGVASGLVDSKKHWVELVAWLNPRSTRVETTPRDGVGKLITSSGLYLERCGPWIKMEGLGVRRDMYSQH
jgi:hypothetical protein